MILRQGFARVCIYILVFHYDCCEGVANLQTNDAFRHVVTVARRRGSIHLHKK